MLIIRDQQLKVFERSAWDRFAGTQLQHVKTYFPVDWRLLGGDDETLAFIAAGIDRCVEEEVTVQGDACRFVDLMLTLGLDFATDPQLPWARAELDDPRQSRSTRIDRLHAAAMAYLERVAGEEGDRYRKAILRAGRMTYEEITQDGGDFGASVSSALSLLWPRKRRELRGATMEAFQKLAAERAGQDGLWAPGQRMLYATLMILLGSRFTSDPMYPWAARTVSDPDLRGEDRARTLHAGAKAHLELAIETLRQTGGA